MQQNLYVYAPAYTQTSKTISETIKYIDQDGKEVAIGYTADPITFVTVTNPVDNTTTTYYSTKAKTATLDDNGVPTEAGWTKADSTDFAEVVSPELKGYTADKAQIDKQTVNVDSKDLEFTVTYTKNAPTTPAKPVNPSQPTTPAKPVNPSQPTTPTKPVQAGQAAATNFVDQRLPQTGETDQQHMTLSGLLLLAMSSLLGLFGMTKRQRKE